VGDHWKDPKCKSSPALGMLGTLGFVVDAAEGVNVDLPQLSGAIATGPSLLKLAIKKCKEEHPVEKMKKKASPVMLLTAQGLEFNSRLWQLRAHVKECLGVHSAVALLQVKSRYCENCQCSGCTEIRNAQQTTVA
jgi:hypothetical protein